MSDKPAMSEAEYLAKLTALADADCVVSRIGLEVYRGRDEARSWILRMADRIGLAHEILANLAERKAKMSDDTIAEGRRRFREELQEVTAERDRLRALLTRLIPASSNVPDHAIYELDWSYAVRCRPGKTDTCEGVTLGELRAALAPKV